MPFIGQDWRSPGEVWIKTIEGWELMKLLRKSHFVRHQNDHQIFCHNNNSVPCPGSSSLPPPHPSNCDVVSHRVVVLPSSSSSSLDSSGVSAGSTDSDSESELIVPDRMVMESSKPVPVPKYLNSHKIRHQSGDSNSSLSSSSLSSSSPEPPGLDGSPLSLAEIIQSLQRSSSQPIPMDILKESSEQIEIYHTQPYYRITMNPTREVQGSNIISDAFYKLDFCNAIRDIRRFAYVSKLLHLLITQNLTSLSGNATKALFWMLEEIAKQVASNKQNIHVIRELLVELREIVDKYLCWGRPLGSTSLWEQHLRTMERICEMTDAIEIKPPESNGKPSWSELPEELIREILLRLSDYKDLERSAQACQRMNSLLNEEQHIWKQLVKYHFTKDQLNCALKMVRQNHHHHQCTNAANAENADSVNRPNVPEQKRCPVAALVDENDDDDLNGNKPSLDWERLFHLLRKKFGLKEEYADCLFLCRYCRCLFWKSKNHPCILENPDLTRQVLVTSPLTGFTSSITKPGSKFHAELQQNRRNFSPGQQPPAATSSSSATVPNQTSAAAERPQPYPAPSSSSSQSGPTQRPPLFLQAVQPPQPQPLPGGPLMVQSIPFFEHPLVIQRLNNHNNDNLERSGNSKTASFQKAPLHVPITPHAFLKFFSL